MTPATARVEPRTGSAVLDPMGPTETGIWSHDGVTVCNVRVREPAVQTAADHACQSGPGVSTAHFTVHRTAQQLTVLHRLLPGELSDQLTHLVTAELSDSGLLRGQREFELIMTGLVRSTVSGAVESWRTFYANTLAQLESGVTDFAAIHARALELLTGSTVLELGSCFGFFALRATSTGRQVIATDISEGTMRLLQTVAPSFAVPPQTAASRQTAASPQTAVPLQTLVCDAGRCPLPDDSADTVCAIHLLEHLDPEHGFAVVQEALRLARKRVIVAVPFESEATACFGHVRTFTLESLRDLGERSGAPFTVDELHGGWLVLDAGRATTQAS